MFDDGDVIREWQRGSNKEVIAKKYMKYENERRKRIGEKKISKEDALAYVEPIIFKYQTKLMRGTADEQIQKQKDNY